MFTLLPQTIYYCAFTIVIDVFIMLTNFVHALVLRGFCLLGGLLFLKINDYCSAVIIE